MIDWADIHAYQHLVKTGKAPTLECSCGNEYITQLGENDGVMLRCYFCNSKTTPGLALEEEIKSYL